MRILGRTAMAILIWSGLCWAGRQVVFIGLSGDGAPAVEKTYDRLLREQLSVMPEVEAGDYMEAQRFRERINFFDHQTVSVDLVRALDQFAPDTTLFVWGVVKQYRMRPVRRFLFGAAVRADLTIGLSMYSLSNRKYAFAGDIVVSASKSKGLVLFDRVDKAVHVSALDRTDLLEKLETEAVRESGRMIAAVVRSENEQDKAMRGDVDRYKVPSLSDVFEVPSVEPPVVSDTTDSASAGTAPRRNEAKADTAASK